MLRMLSHTNLKGRGALWYCNRVEDLDAFYTFRFALQPVPIDGSTLVSGGYRPFARPPGARGWAVRRRYGAAKNAPYDEPGL